MNITEAKSAAAEGQFEAGTMLPKIEAAVSYLEKIKTGKVIITSMDKVKEAVNGETGTVITYD